MSGPGSAQAPSRVRGSGPGPKAVAVHGEWTRSSTGRRRGRGRGGPGGRGGGGPGGPGGPPQTQTDPSHFSHLSLSLGTHSRGSSSRRRHRSFHSQTLDPGMRRCEYHGGPSREPGQGAT